MSIRRPAEIVREIADGIEADQRVYRAGQCAGQREEHGHGSVTDRIAPHTVDSPSITAVGYDEADNGHQNRGQHGHFLKVQPHMDVIILKRLFSLTV